jgi:hypothetical protein
VIGQGAAVGTGEGGGRVGHGRSGFTESGPRDPSTSAHPGKGAAGAEMRLWAGACARLSARASSRSMRKLDPKVRSRSNF